MERLKRWVGGSGWFTDFAALSDVCLRVERGEAVGIIGENGAGKSTLLKIVAGTTAPSIGAMEVNGSVAAILELGSAFHPEFTGRQNAILYGALMGFSRREMEERLDDILSFAELGEFIDRPLKTYSTGMAMRLGFAVATNVEPDVLVVDEALAVGDGYFQKKCVDKMLEIKERGTTVLFCSHSMYYVTSFCERAVWLKDGRIEQEGRVDQVVNEYEEFLVTREKRRMERAGGEAEAGAALAGGQQAAISAIRVFDDSGRPVEMYHPGINLLVEIEWRSADPEAHFHLGVSLDRGDGARVVGVSTQLDGETPDAGAGTHTARVRLENLPLARGTYSVSAYLFDESGLHVYDQAVLTDHLRPDREEWAPALLEVSHSWEV